MTRAAATILAIDDDPRSLDVSLRFLTACDYAVLTARDGERGFRRALHVRPDLVLLDLGLPDIDGHEVCRRLRAHPLTTDIPVLFLSARAGPDEKVRSFELDGVDYLVKPVAPTELVARVRYHLENARRRREAAAELDRVRSELEEVRSQLSTVLERRAEEAAELNRLRVQVDAQQSQLDAWLDRWIQPSPTTGVPPRLDTTERVRLALESLDTLARGAAGERDLDRIARLLRPVVSGETALVAAALDPLSVLSKRELEVFELLVDGRTNKDISLALGVSTSTVSTYRARVLEKLDAENVADLVRIRIEHG